MGMLDLEFEVLRLDGVEEVWPEGLPAIEVPEFLARLKGEAARRLVGPDDLVITADTVVINDGRIYGKPHTEAEAVEMLLSLAGHTHQVATGVALVRGTAGTEAEASARYERTEETGVSMRSFTVVTDVTFGPISREEAEYYVGKYRPLDKAGAYGIQEWIGCVAVESINGSFYNVMGLPVQRLYREVKRFTSDS